ncbi:MAG: hypothetical protein H7234_07020 [Herminiimonas sp.]|nr:hypothetical protein [Herminiimonas sp.]
MQSKIALAATSGNSGSTWALLYVEVRADVCGWFLDATARHYRVAFFMLENFYATAPAVLYRSVTDDVYGSWVRDEPPATHIIRCPLPENVVHEIEPLKSKLMQDWLTFDDGPTLLPNAARLPKQDAGRPECAVSIKPSKLSRLKRGTAGLHYATPGFDANVVDYLQKFRRDQ